MTRRLKKEEMHENEKTARSRVGRRQHKIDNGMKTVWGGGRRRGERWMERQVRLIKRSGSSFLIDGSSNTHICTHRHSQALDDALKLDGLAP